MKIQLYFYAVGLFLRYMQRKSARLERENRELNERAAIVDQYRLVRLMRANAGKRKPKRKGKPERGVWSKECSRLASKPKIVRGSDFAKVGLHEENKTHRILCKTAYGEAYL